MDDSIQGEPVDYATWIKVAELHQRYADSIDRADIPALLALFAPDAVWEYSPTVHRQGHAAMEDFFQERLRAFDRTSHNVHPPIVRRGPEAGTYTSRAYFIGMHRLRDGSDYCVWGRYLDQLADTGRGLLITRRAVVAHLTEGTSRVFNMLQREPVAGVDMPRSADGAATVPLVP